MTVESSLLTSIFQSTLPRGERRCSYSNRSCSLQISIHAPTRGATGSTTYTGLSICISIHAPTRGATWKSILDSKLKYISIHAPTRGATGIGNMSFSTRLFQSTLPRGERRRSSAHNWDICNFNPRSHEGSDLKTSFKIRSIYVFQSTLPRGERRKPRMQH